MAKKRQQDDNEEPMPVVSEAPPMQSSEQPSQSDSHTPLMQEIQTFMSMRDELAQKLAAEIEATERKLEELRNTAASLFPQSSNSGSDKKAKKPKPKASKDDKASGDSTSEI